LSVAVERATTRHNYYLVAFVFMPEHVHLLLYPGENASHIDALLTAIKRPFSFRIKKLLSETKSQLLQRLTIQQRPGIQAFRFWQEGPGYDRNLDCSDTVLAAIEYIHRNPERRGLVARAIDWQWSSARSYESLPYDAAICLPTLSRLPAEFLMKAAR
jgi:putative transposase